MSLESSLRSLMDQTVTRNAAATLGFRGQETFSTTTQTYAARVEGHQHVVVNPEGKEVLAKTVIYVGTTSTGGVPAFTVNDKITLPDASTPPILSVDTVRDASGVHHQAVHCG